MASNTKGEIRNPELRRILAETVGIRKTTFLAPAADDDWFDASQVYAAATALTVLAAGMTNSSCPGHPVVPVLVSDEDTTDSWTAVSAVVTGIDQFGDFCQETVAHTNSSGTWTGTCVNAYQELVSTVTTVTGTTSAADAQVIGFAKTYGLGCRIGATGEVLSQRFDGAEESGTLSAANATVIIAGTPDAAKLSEYYIRSSIYADKRGA
jgi:hypothetical protein